MLGEPQNNWMLFAMNRASVSLDRSDEIQSDLCCRLTVTRRRSARRRSKTAEFGKNEVTSGHRQAAVERGDLLVFKVFHTQTTKEEQSATKLLGRY